MRSVNIIAGLSGAIVATAAGGRADAAIVYTDIPDATLGFFGMASLDLDRDGAADFEVISFDTGIGPQMYANGLQPGSEVLIDPLLTWGTSTWLRYWADRLSLGTPIGPGFDFESRANLLIAQDFGPVYGKWLGLGESYLGVEFRIGSGTHYGWIRAERTTFNFNAYFVIYDFAYESDPSVPIAAGAVPTPATFVIALVPLTLGPRRRHP